MPPIYDITGDSRAQGIYDSLEGDDGGGQPVEKLNARDLPIGFAGCALVTVPASGSVVQTFNLNMVMRPDVYILEDAVAPNVTVADIKVGAISLNASADAACGDAFRHNTVSRLKGAVSGTPSVPVKVTLTNKTTNALLLVGGCLKGPIKRVA